MIWLTLFLALLTTPLRADELMVHGYSYLVGTSETGPRGVNSLSSPNMLMSTWDHPFTKSQTLHMQLMLTAERWTLPDAGYPELLQVGESRGDGSAYIDYQHPHSSPIMGIGVADTIELGDSNHTLELSFAPRGPSSDGPIAFMHRVTGAEYNPDAPLGHHIGQDVGHISSTVAGAALEIFSNKWEVSAFNGDEPQPTKVDLPIGPINSFAARWTHTWSEEWQAMASWAYVTGSHHHGDEDAHALSTSEPSQVEQRTSASVYWSRELAGWHVYDTLIFGELDTRSSDTTQVSFLDEFVFQRLNHAWWGRVEVLQRLPEELAIDTNVANQDSPRWVKAITLGFTQRIADLGEAELKAGVSATLDVVPKDFEADYGAWPMTGRIFLQLTGMKMWQL